jgi:hypothetical protein
MIKKYKLEGKEFQTVIIPRGTILFRGIHFENKHKYDKIFSDIIGIHDGHAPSIAPTMNVFFYPVPYVSDVVDIFNIHIMYITQYDIELMLLVSPSTISRNDIYEMNPNKDEIALCSNISDTDKCGFKMSTSDPCLTDIVRRRFPQIDGYIAIAKGDAETFSLKFKNMTDVYERYNLAKQMLSSIITDYRGVEGIPEIVIHPLRFREQDCFRIRDRFYNSERIVKYCVENRALYNYFPLLYFTNKGVYTLNDLKSDDIISDISLNTRHINTKAIPDLYENINSIFSAMLTKEGYKIKNIVYKAFVDKRTGFYKVYVESTSKKINKYTKRNKGNKTYKSIKHNFKDDAFEGYLNTYIIKPINDPRLNTVVSSYDDYMRDFIKDLGANGYSAKKALVFDRGAKDKFAYKYYIDKVIDRPDLAEYKNMRRRKKNITNKQRNMQIAEFFKASGLDPDNISNINENDYEILETK